MSDPVATLEIYDADDIPLVREMLQQFYGNVKVQYEYGPTESMPERIGRQGSLCQDMLAQVNQMEMEQ